MFKHLILLLVISQIYFAQCQLSQQEKNTILTVHNQLRDKVAGGNAGLPTAANMAELVWNRDLENKAQQWANRKQFAHNPDRDVNGETMGENIYIDMSSNSRGFDPKKPVMSWYSEIKDFDSSSISEYQFSSGTGHFTQIAWAKTTQVGCGKCTYQQGGWYKNLVVCDYLPAGNFMGEPMYEEGDAGSSCESRSQKYSNLCAPSDRLFTEDELIHNLLIAYDSILEKKLKEIKHKKNSGQ